MILNAFCVFRSIVMGREVKQQQPHGKAQKSRKQSTAKGVTKKVMPQSVQPVMTEAKHPTPAGILTLQRTLGNQAVTRLIQRRKVSVTQQSRPGIQRMFDESKRKRREARGILLNLQNKEWALAKEKTKQENIVYEPAVFMGGNKWVKGFRGVGGWSGASLNNTRKNAKALHSNTNLKGNDRHNKISEIAAQAHQVTNKDHLFGTNWQHSANIARKITFYLVNSIPTNQTDLEETLTLASKEEANALEAKIKNILLENIAVDEGFIKNFMSNNQLVKDILSGDEENIPIGRLTFAAQVEKQADELASSKEQQTKPQMALGFSNAYTFAQEQIKIMKRFNTDPNTKLTKMEQLYLDSHKGGKLDHKLQKDVSDKLPGKPKAYYDWEQAGWMEDVPYAKTTNEDWKLGFDKATHHITMRGGKIHFDLSGFRKDDIQNIKGSKYFLTYGPTNENQKGKPNSFKGRHPFPSIGDSHLKYGMGITHWELGQIMFNKNLWDRTTFYRYDSLLKKPVAMKQLELNALKLVFMG